MTNGALPKSTVCDSAGVDPVSISERAEELAAALAEGSLDRIQALADPEFWERDGAEDYGARLPVAGAVELLGTLGDRSLLWVGPGSDGGGYALEQAWSDETPPVVADERLFTLLDAEALRAEGDEERLERAATKLAGQDAAGELSAAFDRQDSDAVRALVEPERTELAEAEAARAVGATRAELIGSVGPRTLVRVWSGDSDVTVEYLWRPRGESWRIGFAREFSRTG